MNKSDSYCSLILFQRGKVKVRNDLDRDEVDLGVTRQTGVLHPERASILDNVFALLAILTYMIDIGTDVLVARKYLLSGDYWWFGWTVVFVVFPLSVIQVFSYKWYKEDDVKLSCGTLLAHVFLLGPIERYLNAFWFGLKTMLSTKVSSIDYHRYLVEWRDITMLRLFEAFLEAGPQVTLQLYILSSVTRFSLSNDWLTVLSASCSVVSLAWAIASYSHALRLCCRSRGFSILAYGCQTCYRLFMVASRIIALVVFASQYKEWIFAFVCFHWGVMTLWLSAQDTRFCRSGNERIELCQEKCFSAVMGVVYVFCFMNIRQGETRRRIAFYYILMFCENCVLVGLWFPRHNFSDHLAIGCLAVVFGGFACGLVCMILYYHCLHPSSSDSESYRGCCCCCQDNESSFKGSDDKLEITPGHLGAHMSNDTVPTRRPYVPMAVEYDGSVNSFDVSSFSDTTITTALVRHSNALRNSIMRFEAAMNQPIYLTASEDVSSNSSYQPFVHPFVNGTTHVRDENGIASAVSDTESCNRKRSDISNNLVTWVSQHLRESNHSVNAGESCYEHDSVYGEAGPVIKKHSTLV